MDNLWPNSRKLGVGEGGAAMLRRPRETVIEEEDNVSDFGTGMLNDPERDNLVGDSRGTTNSVELLLLPNAYRVVVLPGEGGMELFDFRDDRLLSTYQRRFRKTKVKPSRP